MPQSIARLSCFLLSGTHKISLIRVDREDASSSAVSRQSSRILCTVVNARLSFRCTASSSYGIRADHDGVEVCRLPN